MDGAAVKHGVSASESFEEERRGQAEDETETEEGERHLRHDAERDACLRPGFSEIRRIY